MLYTNVLLYEITNIEFRSIHEKYTLNDTPTESTFRKTYMCRRLFIMKQWNLLKKKCIIER